MSEARGNCSSAGKSSCNFLSLPFSPSHNSRSVTSHQVFDWHATQRGWRGELSSVISKHRDSKLRFGELLPVSVAFKTSHTALEADCPGNSGTKQEVPFTKSTLESHSLYLLFWLPPARMLHEFFHHLVVLLVRQRKGPGLEIGRRCRR